jgi:hypothetical protein
MRKLIIAFKAMLLCVALLAAQSCGKQGNDLPQINGVEGPIFNVVDGQVVLTFKFLAMQIEAGLKLPIPKTKNSFMEFSPNVMDGGMMLQVFMDVKDLKEISIGVGDGNYLPDGRPLPGVPGGRLDDSLRIDTDFYDVSFYYHKKLFGFWIPVGFETAGISGYWNLNVNQKRIGLLGLVGDDPNRGFKAGGIVLLNLDALKDKQLQKLIDVSKRNPGFVF